MTWCNTCGAQYSGPEHACGFVTITKDRLRELERIAEDARGDDQKAKERGR